MLLYTTYITMILHEKIKGEIPVAMKARDEDGLRFARNLVAAFINDLVARKKKPSDTLTDEEALTVVARLAKQRKESIEQFRTGGREDLVGPEERELAYLQALLPQMMSKEDIRKIAEAKKAELGVTDKSKMGMFMGTVMSELKNKADGKEVKEIVESLFT